jgi:hypothetical protein
MSVVQCSATVHSQRWCMLESKLDFDDLANKLLRNIFVEISSLKYHGEDDRWLEMPVSGSLNGKFVTSRPWRPS